MELVPTWNTEAGVQLFTLFSGLLLIIINDHKY